MNNIHSLTGENCTVTFQTDSGHILVGKATIEEARTCPDRWAEDWSVKLRGWRKVETVSLDKWINVEDELPKVGQLVNVIYNGGPIEKIMIGRRLKDRYYYYGEHNWSCANTWERAFQTTEITHWMPLPDPPKKEGPFHGAPYHPSVYLDEYGYICTPRKEIDVEDVCRRLNEAWQERP